MSDVWTAHFQSETNQRYARNTSATDDKGHTTHVEKINEKDWGTIQRVCATGNLKNGMEINLGRRWAPLGQQFSLLGATVNGVDATMPVTKDGLRVGGFYYNMAEYDNADFSFWGPMVKGKVGKNLDVFLAYAHVDGGRKEVPYTSGGDYSRGNWTGKNAFVISASTNIARNLRLTADYVRTDYSYGEGMTAAERADLAGGNTNNNNQAVLARLDYKWTNPAVKGSFGAYLRYHYIGRNGTIWNDDSWGSIPSNSRGWTNGNPFNVNWYNDNVTFHNGNMQLIIDDDFKSTNEVPYSGGEFRSKAFYGYGRYEVSLKAIKNDGVVSSFFTYTGPSDNNPWDEIDVEVLGKDTSKVQFNYFRDGKGEHEYMYDLGFDASEDFHTYAFEWHKDKIIWFVDGKEAHRVDKAIPVIKGKIMMNAWAGKNVDAWLNHFNDKKTDAEERAWLAAELFKTTGDEVYEDYLKGKAKALMVRKPGFFTWNDTLALAQFAYLTSRGADEELQAKTRTAFLGYADDICAKIAKDGFACALAPNEYTWASTKNALSQGEIPTRPSTWKVAGFLLPKHIWMC